MQISTLIKVVATMIVFTILACTLIIVNNYFGDSPESKNKVLKTIEDKAPDKESNSEIVEIESLRKRISKKNAPEIVLGAPALRKAKNVLLESKFDEAKVLLERIVDIYEDTPAEYEAHRILGEMNMDELFEIKEDDERIVEYTVRPGDTYLGIAQKHETNFDLMMLLNGMTSKNSSNLQPKQKLLLMPLNFSLRIIPQKNQLFLMNKNGDILKMYEPIVDMVIPKKKDKVVTTIDRMAAYYNDRRVNSTRGNYREASKTIKVQNPAVEIIGETSSVPASFKGIVLAKPDIEELMLLLRHGNSVEILY